MNADGSGQAAHRNRGQRRAVAGVVARRDQHRVREQPRHARRRDDRPRAVGDERRRQRRAQADRHHGRREPRAGVVADRRRDRLPQQRRPGGYDLYAIAASATPGAGTDARVRLTTNFVSDENPELVADGARIAFERGNGTNAGDRPRSCGRWTPTARTRWRSPRTASTTRIRRGRRTARGWRSRAGQTATRDLLAARRRRDRAEPHEHELRHRRRPAGLGRRVGTPPPPPPPAAPPPPPPPPPPLRTRCRR